MSHPSSTHLTGLALALLLLVSSARQDAEGRPVVEEQADGGRIEYRVVDGEGGGEPVRHGAYRVLDAEGTVLAEGRYERGARSGEWTTRYAGGRVAARGPYVAGERHGPWLHFHPNGEKASEGVYRHGIRAGRWRVWDAAGKPVRGESGDYEAVLVDWRDGVRRYAGANRGGRPHGPWTFWSSDGRLRCEGSYRLGRRTGTWTFLWPDGRIQLEAGYERGLRDGACVFRHADGTIDPRMLTGRYAKGRRMGNLDVDGLGAGEDVPAATDLSRLPPPRPPFGTSAETWERVRGLVRAWREAGSQRTEERGEASDAARVALSASGLAAVPALLEALMALDLSRPEDALLGGVIAIDLLPAQVGGHAFGWRSEAAPEDVAHNALAVRRWHSLWCLLRSAPGLSTELARTRPSSVPSAALCELDFEDAVLGLGADAPAEAVTVTPAADATPSTVRIDRARARRREGGGGTEKALEAALAWLVRNQEPDGSWSAANHDGRPGMEVGVTALALAALQADGSTTEQGPHREAVARGIAWLLEKQDPATGRIGDTRRRGGLAAGQYGHAMATEVLCTAWSYAPDPELRAAVEKAVQHVLDARNPRAGWRYQPAPNGQSDTSVTCWMVSALHAARGIGLDVPDAAFRGALAWLDQVTVLNEGRVGYDAPGSYSARVSGVNDDQDPLSGEAMTAAGLWIRFLAGQEPDRVREMGEHAAMIAGTPFRWEAKATDLYYAYHASQAMFQMGGRWWRDWNDATKRVLLAAQRNAGPLHGSWDPETVWGMIGGRVYTTALGALCLEVYWRHPRLVD